MPDAEKDRMRGTGGNRFIPADATRADLMRTINDQLGDLHEWATETDQVLDLAEVTVSTKRIRSGLISVSVTADLTDHRDEPKPKWVDLFGIDPDFTGGMHSVCYVRWQRDDEESMCDECRKIVEGERHAEP